MTWMPEGKEVADVSCVTQQQRTKETRRDRLTKRAGDWKSRVPEKRDGARNAIDNLSVCGNGRKNFATGLDVSG